MQLYDLCPTVHKLSARQISHLQSIATFPFDVSRANCMIAYSKEGKQTGVSAIDFAMKYCCLTGYNLGANYFSKL